MEIAIMYKPHKTITIILTVTIVMEIIITWYQIKAYLNGTSQQNKWAHKL